MTMLDQSLINEEIASAVEWRQETMPAKVRTAIACADWSLYNGPSGGGRRMSFEEATGIIRDWAAEIDDIIMEIDGHEDEATGEWIAEMERIDGTADLIRRNLIGAELMPYCA
jgi:hypothetical protein